MGPDLVRHVPEPVDSKKADDAEIEYISQGGGLVDLGSAKTKSVAPKMSNADFALVLGRKKLWGIYIGQFCLTSTLWFFLTWFPTYLVTYRHMNYIKTGFLTLLPFIAALAGVLISGVLSDFMLKRGVSLGTSRKLPIITGVLLHEHDWCNLHGQHRTGHHLHVDCFLRQWTGFDYLVLGICTGTITLDRFDCMFNFIGNLSSIATPIVIGLLVSATDFGPTFIYMTVIAAAGILSYVF